MGDRYTILLVAVSTAFLLHILSEVSLSGSGDGTYAGIFSAPALTSDTTIIEGMLQKRAQLSKEISQLEAMLQELDKVDAAAFIQNFKLRSSSSSSSSSGTSALPATSPITIPDVPPALPVIPTADLTSSYQLATSPRSPAPENSSPSEESSSLLIFQDSLRDVTGLRDFPCALRNFKKAQVTTTCVIDCEDSACGHALEVCAGYVECNYVVIPAKKGEDLSRVSATLKRDPSLVMDKSMELLQASKWWGNPALGTDTRPRIYIVASYGGCGSKMMAGFLSQLPKAHKTYVYHIHDRSPPKLLHQMPKPPPPTIRSGGNDFRSGRFPGGSKFKRDTELVDDLNEYRVVYMYKDPVEALVSRYGWGHCNHIQGDCGEAEAQWPKLDKYAKKQVDRMRLKDHFNAFHHPEEPREFPIVAINYHRLWDNIPAVLMALGLPASLASTFPPRTETVRNDMTGKSEGNAAHTEETRSGLKRMYAELQTEVLSNPAVLIV